MVYFTTLLLLLNLSARFNCLGKIVNSKTIMVARLLAEIQMCGWDHEIQIEPLVAINKKVCLAIAIEQMQ